MVFRRLLIASLYSKHPGFGEENEWRIVYIRSDDHADVLKSSFGYFNGPNGLEPKLKLKIEPTRGLAGTGPTLESLIDHIILGPSRSSSLAEGTARRMMIAANKIKLANKIKASQIPFRFSL